LVINDYAQGAQGEILTDVRNRMSEVRRHTSEVRSQMSEGESRAGREVTWDR